MLTFQEMNLPESLNNSLKRVGFEKPTPIQEKTIPVALQGKDILGSAQTGTGKTAAFAIPIISKLVEEENSVGLILTPTRELAKQVLQQIRDLLDKKEKIKSILLIGGDPIKQQFISLKKKPRLIIGTPGRINDHLKRGSLTLKKVAFLVMDETDRMLDMGFSDQIENIVKHIPKKRQTLLFSATLPKNIINIAEKYMNDPIHISVGETSAPADKVKQDILQINRQNKYDKLLSELDSREGSIIVFVNTKHGTDKIAKQLLSEGHNIAALHGDLRQNKRDRIISAFRKKKYRILVATDVAARGIDIPHIEHVINYDLPQCAEDYIHRIGRTARAGAEGQALSFVTPGDKRKWQAINNLLNPGQKSTQKEKKPVKKQFLKKKKGAATFSKKKKKGVKKKTKS